MRIFVPAVVLYAFLAFFFAPEPSEAQFRIGAHAAHAGKAFDGSAGLGVRGGLQLPVLPIDILGTGEYFFPDCPTGQDGCGLQGLSLDGNFRFFFPFVRPYLSGGVAYRRLDPGGGGTVTNDTGISVGAGVDVRLGALGGFAEGRYEFLDAPTSQAILRIGVLLGLF